MTIVADSSTSPTPAGAPSLGVGREANGRRAGFNISSPAQEDWLAIDLTSDAVINITLLTGSLDPPSPLDGSLTFFAPASAAEHSPELAQTGAVQFDDTIEDLAIDVDGTHLLRITGNDGTSGHYELDIDVVASPVDSVSVTPAAATIPIGDSGRFVGRAFDSAGLELIGRGAHWSVDRSPVALGR